MSLKSVLVGVTSYNHKKYIVECIESVLKQTYPCRIYVTDDRSTDGTQDVIKSYSNIIATFHNDNSGTYVRGANDIIEMSMGFDYTYFLSADDILYSNAIEGLVKCAEEWDADWTYGGLDLVNENGVIIEQWVYEGAPETVPQAIAYMWRRKSNGVPFALFKGQFLKGKKFTRFPHTNFSEDAATCIEWLASWPTIRRVRQQTLRYRQHSGTETNILGNSIDRQLMEIDLREKMKATFGYENIMACRE
jgi:glycosyltransferase involved in cell wall biosynthesis